MTEIFDNPEDAIEEQKPDPEETKESGGELEIATGVAKDGDVFIRFSKETKWVWMDPNDALELAQAIMLNAQKALRVRSIIEQRKKGAVGDSILTPALVDLDGQQIKKG